MEQKLVITPSPHIHSGDSMQKIMWTVVWAMIPTWLVGVYYFGLGAVQVTAVAVAAVLFFEWAITKHILKRTPTLMDGSAMVTGILLAMNLPSNLPVYMVIIGAFVAIAIGKLSFGGLGQNLFNPALVGRVFLLISFPAAMTTWPVPKALTIVPDGTTGATVLGILKEGVRNGEKVPDLLHQMPSMMDMFLGKMGGSFGEISAIAILLGLAYMMYKKVVTWHIPVSMVGTVVIITGIMHWVNPDQYVGPLFHVLTGGLLLGAVFMATDMVASPMTRKGQLVYGAGIGLITVVIRLWGAYPEGVSFAILLMNGWSPLISRYMKPRRYGTK